MQYFGMGLLTVYCPNASKFLGQLAAEFRNESAQGAGDHLRANTWGRAGFRQAGLATLDGLIRARSSDSPGGDERAPPLGIHVEPFHADEQAQVYLAGLPGGKINP